MNWPLLVAEIILGRMAITTGSHLTWAFHQIKQWSLTRKAG